MMSEGISLNSPTSLDLPRNPSLSMPSQEEIKTSGSGNKCPDSQTGSPVGAELVGLKYIDDTGSLDNLLEDDINQPVIQAGLNSIVTNQPRKDQSISVCGDHVDENDDFNACDKNNTIVHQLSLEAPQTICPPGLESLLDTGQLVIHMGNLRQNIVIDESVTRRMEVIDETRRVLFHVEKDRHGLPTDTSFRFRLYNRDKVEVMQVYSPSSTTCICCGASWHWFQRCRFQAMVYAPPGIVAGFIRRSRTKFVQEFQILNPNEEPLLVLRGGPQDLEIYSLDFENELGRLSVHGWMGIMHEVRRSSGDYGLTFPLDLDVRVKSLLLGTVFAINWLYSTKGGKRNT